MKPDYHTIHTAARLARAFSDTALAHLDHPAPERLQEALDELRMALDEVGRLPSAPSLVMNQAGSRLGPSGDHQLSQGLDPN